MATSYNKESHATTTQTETYPGYGIMCDNVEFYCSDENYYCDGSVVLTDISHATTTPVKESY